MSLYLEYIAEIESRKKELGLAPKPIDGATRYQAQQVLLAKKLPF